MNADALRECSLIFSTVMDATGSRDRALLAVREHVRRLELVRVYIALTLALKPFHREAYGIAVKTLEKIK